MFYISYFGVVKPFFLNFGIDLILNMTDFS